MKNLFVVVALTCLAIFMLLVGITRPAGVDSDSDSDCDRPCDSRTTGEETLPEMPAAEKRLLFSPRRPSYWHPQ